MPSSSASCPGIVHTYYSVALAPAVAALVGAGAVDLWRLRARARLAGLVLAGAVILSAWWAFMLLDRSPDFAPGLGIGILVVGASAAVVLAFPLHVAGRRPSIAAAGLAMAVLLAGPLAYGFQTIATAQNGGDPSAGPAVARSDGGFGGPGGGPQGNAGGGSQGNAGFTPPTAPGGSLGAGPSGGFGAAGGAGAGGPGGSVDQSVIDYLVANRGSATWLVATTSSGSAGSIELATGAPVMAMGGFTGSDPTPTLTELQSYIRSGELRFVLLGGGGGPGGSSGTSDRDAWIAASCTAVDTGSGTTSGLYDCEGAVP